MNHSMDIPPSWVEQPVTVCGIGCLGARIAEMLMRMGLEHLCIVDHDRVEEKDCRQGIYWREHVGALKVDALARMAAAIGAPTRIKSMAQRCERLGPGALRREALVIAALDDLPPRLILAQAAMEAGTNFLDAAVDGLNGRITEIAGAGACYHCHHDVQALAAGDPMVVAASNLSRERGCRADAGRPTVAAPFAIAEVAATAVGRAVRVLGGQGSVMELRLSWSGAASGGKAIERTGMGGTAIEARPDAGAVRVPVWRRFELPPVAGCPTCAGGGSSAVASRPVTLLAGCRSARDPLAVIEREARRACGPGDLEGPRPWSAFGERPPAVLWCDAPARELGVPDGGRLRFMRALGGAVGIELARDDEADGARAEGTWADGGPVEGAWAAAARAEGPREDVA